MGIRRLMQLHRDRHRRPKPRILDLAALHDLQCAHRNPTELHCCSYHHEWDEPCSLVNMVFRIYNHSRLIGIRTVVLDEHDWSMEAVHRSLHTEFNTCRCRTTAPISNILTMAFVL